MLTDADRAQLDRELLALAVRVPQMQLPPVPDGTLAGIPLHQARKLRFAAAWLVEASHEAEYAYALAVARAAGAETEWAATVLLARAHPAEYRAWVDKLRDRRAGGAA